MKLVIFVSLTVLSLTLTSTVYAKIDPENVVAAWLFDTGEGEITKDSSGKGHDGEIFGANWVQGKYGQGLQFNGEDNSRINK